MAPLEGRSAVVTGGSRGVGRAIAEALAADGAAVGVNYRKDADAAAETVAGIEAAGGRAVALAGDISSYDDCESIAAAALEALGPVGILVNNAGIASRGRSLVDTDPAEYDRALHVHAVGPAWLTGLLLPAMREQERGDIVFVSSIATKAPSPNGAPYNMGKAAMEALAFGLARDERPNGIRVNIVAPGLVVTDMGRRLAKSWGVDDITTMDKAMPYGRVCRPEDVAGVVRFLVSDAAGYVNGQRIYVDGGGP